MISAIPPALLAAGLTPAQAIELHGNFRAALWPGEPAAPIARRMVSYRRHTARVGFPVLAITDEQAELAVAALVAS